MLIEVKPRFTNKWYKTKSRKIYKVVGKHDDKYIVNDEGAKKPILINDCEVITTIEGDFSTIDKEETYEIEG